MSEATTPPVTPAPVVIQQPTKGEAKTVDLRDVIREAVKPSRKERRAAIESRAEERGRNELLKEMGVKKSDRARMTEEIKSGRVNLAQANADHEKVAGELKTRADKAEAELATLKLKLAAVEPLAKQFADDQFAALDEPAQKLIAKLAGDSLDKRLELIKEMKEAGMLSKQEAAAAAATAKTEAKPVNPATTSKATNPKAPAATVELTPRQVWEQMRVEREGESQAERIARRHLAARFYAANQNAIDRDWP